MSSNKKTKSKFNFIIICIIGFIISIFFEFYFISYFPYDYFMLFGTGIIMCILGYLSIDGVLEIINQTSRKRDEQNEIMIKASKAIYLTTKKIALNSHSMPDTLEETPKDFGSLIDDLSQANERLAKEVENAVSLQSLVQKNRSIVNNAREIIENHEQPLSPLEIEKNLKLDEAISETDFETVTQPEIIDSMIKQEAAAGMAAQKEEQPKMPMAAAVSETISDNQAEPDISSETASDIFSEVKETAGHILNDSAEANTKPTENNIPAEANANPTENNIPAEANIKPTENNIPAEANANPTENNIPAEANANPIGNNIPVENNTKPAENSISTENNETASSSKEPASNTNTADKPMTSEEIAALFANL